MDKEEFDLLVESIEKLTNSVNSLVEALKQTNTPVKQQTAVKTDSNDINTLMKIATDKAYTDQEYLDALDKIQQLHFNLSAKQLAWICFWTPRNHGECEQEFTKFFTNQARRVKDWTKTREEIISILNEKYSTSSNTDYLNAIIFWIKNLSI